MMFLFPQTFSLHISAAVWVPASVFQVMKQEIFGGESGTNTERREYEKSYVKQGGRYQPGGNQLWASSVTVKEVLLTSQKAGQIRQITTLGESISHIPERPALESGVALESQVSWLK